MKVKEICERLELEPIALPDGEREITGAYAGDLLSWVMGRAGEGNLWITIMTNINVVAVASLADVAAVILAEGTALDEKAAAEAETRGVNVLSSKESVYKLCVSVGALI